MRFLFFVLCVLITAVARAQTYETPYLFQPKLDVGAWHDPNQTGWGYYIYEQNGIIFGASFGYENSPLRDSRFLTIAGLGEFLPNPTGWTNIRPGTPIATLRAPLVAARGGQCHGCPFTAPTTETAYGDAVMTFHGPRAMTLTAGGTSYNLVPFDTMPFDVAGTYQASTRVFVESNPQDGQFTNRSILRLTRRVGPARNFHVDPNLPAGFEMTVPPAGALEYTISCVGSCGQLHPVFAPNAESTWWVDPATGNGGIAFVKDVNPQFFPTPYQLYAPATASYPRWSPQIWAGRDRIVARTYAASTFVRTDDNIRELELVRINPAQIEGLRP